MAGLETAPLVRFDPSKDPSKETSPETVDETAPATPSEEDRRRAFRNAEGFASHDCCTAAG